MANIEPDFKRQEFIFNPTDVEYIKVYTENDFLKDSPKKSIVFELQNDILISTPIRFTNNKIYHIKGHGYKISELGYKPRELYEPIKALSWTIDSINKQAIFRMPYATEKFFHKENDSVYINFEAWFLRFKGKLVNQTDTTLLCKCDDKCLSNKRFLSYTRNPYVFFERVKKRKNNQFLLFLDCNSTMLIEDTKFFNANSLFIRNKGVLKIHRCSFENIEKGCIKSFGSLYLNKSKFSNIQSTPILSVINTYLDVVDSEFNEIGLVSSKSSCINSSGNNYIANNRFIDFNYSGISVGCANAKDEKLLPISCIENNSLYWTDGWTNKIKKYGLKDSGAIYIISNNKLCIVRNNSILNFGGHGSNRAIFCDDGAYNMYIYGNIIIGTQNSFDIDSRDCSIKNNRKKPNGCFFNTNILIANNIYSGYVRMCGSSLIKDNRCFYIDNIKIGPEIDKPNVIKNVNFHGINDCYEKKQ